MMETGVQTELHAKAVPVTFQTELGATIAIPADQALAYALTKAHQLDVLTRLVHDATAGYAIELTQNDIFTLGQLATEAAAENKAVVTAITELPITHLMGADQTDLKSDSTMDRNGAPS